MRSLPTSWLAGLAAAATLSACDPNLPPEIADVPVVERVRHPIDPGADNESRSLLQFYAQRNPVEEAESHAWQLPFQAKRVAVAMLIAAALDRPEDLRFVLTPDATWGLPDRRRVGSRRVFRGDGGEAFLKALRIASARFAEQATFTTKPVLQGVQDIYRVGAEPMWTYWSQGDDYLVTRMIVIKGAARIDYVGLWEGTPDPKLDVSAYGAAPPFIPIVRPERIQLPGM